MARKTVVTFTDDLDGSEASETLEFAFEGRHYVIDLNETHAAEMRAALAPYVKAGRTPGIGVSRQRAEPTSPRIDRETVRRWAKEQGLTVADSGRLSTAVEEAWKKAHY